MPPASETPSSSSKASILQQTWFALISRLHPLPLKVSLAVLLFYLQFIPLLTQILFTYNTAQYSLQQG